MAMRGLVAILMMLALFGCVSVAPGREPAAPLHAGADADIEAVRRNIKIVPDPQAGWTRILGPMVLVDNRVGGRRYVVVGVNDPSDPETDGSFELQASSGFAKRVYLKQIHADGRKLPTKVLDRERIDCGYDCAILETVGTPLSEQQMAIYAASGLTLEVVGRRQDIRMTIPAAYFEAVLTAQRRYRAGSVRRRRRIGRSMPDRNVAGAERGHRRRRREKPWRSVPGIAAGFAVAAEPPGKKNLRPPCQTPLTLRHDGAVGQTVHR
jgi:hypothetical protein